MFKNFIEKENKIMGIIELISLAIGLSMDAFAVSICKGLALPKVKLKNMAVVGLWFGFFQGLMPAIGYLLGSRFSSKISAVDHLIAFILLCLIGVNMIKEAVSGGEESADSNLSFRAMLPLAIATSIDALAVGVTLAFLDVDLLFSVFTIGIITFIISAIGVKIGNVFGVKYKSKAEFTGGGILIILGIKILVEHLFF